MGRTRIPDNVAGFNSYMLITGNYLYEVNSATGLANWQRIGLTSADAGKWLAKCNHWNNSLYPRYISGTLRTQVVTKKTVNFRKSFREACNPILRRIAASVNANEADEVVFRFKRAWNNGRRRNDPITESCFAEIIRIGSCHFIIKCRNAKQRGRAKIAKGADSILMHYKIAANKSLSAEQQRVDETWKTVLITKARTVFKAGSANKGRVLLAAFQWNYRRKESLAGPLSEVQTLLIF